MTPGELDADEMPGGAPTPPPERVARPPEWDSRDLLAGNREAIIRHGADAYWLQLTGSNKLILTK